MVHHKYLSQWNPFDSNEKKTPSKQVVTCFIQSQEKVLVLQRARKDQQHKLWGIPGGKLEPNEYPLTGLTREIYEETGIKLIPADFKLLGTALSYTSSDGEYGLYLYHARVKKNTQVTINNLEHYAFQWVTIDEFTSLNLLTAQGEAFRWVEIPLKNLIQPTSSSKQTKKGGSRARRQLPIVSM